MKRTVRRSLWFLALPALAAPVLAAVTQGGPSGAKAGGNPFELKFSAPSAAHGQALSATCQGCHGAGGVSTNPDTPRLAGQGAGYIRFQLTAFRAKIRPSPVMQRVASHLRDQDIADLAAYFAARPVGTAWKTEDAALRAQGQALFQGGDAKRNVIACAICHGPDGRGEDRLGVASVTNQSPGYALGVLHEFKGAPSFGGIIHPEAMRIALQPLSEADLRAVAAYLSSMK